MTPPRPPTGIRPVAPGQARLIETLEARCSALSWGPGMLAAELARPVTRAWIAWEDGAPVGYLLGWLLGGELEIVAVGVVPEARCRGWGGRLLDRALAEAPEGAWLEVRADNVAARALYSSRGFEVAGRRAGYYGPGRDALTMRRGAIKG